jgi:hypothetical protein
MSLRSIWERVSEAMGSEQIINAQLEPNEAKGLTAEPEMPGGSDASAPAPAPQRAWSPRSRKSIRDEQALEKEVVRCNALIRRAENALARSREEKTGTLKLMKEGESWADKFLSDVLSKIEDQQRQLASFKEIAAKAESDLERFRVGIAAYAPERARIQDYLAALAGVRLEVDCKLEKLLRQALEVLRMREDIVALMQRQAADIELRCNFEAGIPSSLHEALSLDIVSASKAWNAEFLGDQEHLRAYVVCDDSFEPRETLTRKAVYGFGETVLLSESEASEFLRNDRPKASGLGWESLPPSLMTAEAFAAAQAESGLPSGLMKYVLRQKHSELEQKRREAYLLGHRGSPIEGIHLHYP